MNIDYLIGIECWRDIAQIFSVNKTFWPIYHVDIPHVHDYNFISIVYCHSLSTKNRDYACLAIVVCWIFNIAFCQRNFDQCHPHNTMVNRKYYKKIVIYKNYSKFTHFVCNEFTFRLIYVLLPEINWYVASNIRYQSLMNNCVVVACTTIRQ